MYNAGVCYDICTYDEHKKQYTTVTCIGRFWCVNTNNRVLLSQNNTSNHRQSLIISELLFDWRHWRTYLPNHNYWCISLRSCWIWNNEEHLIKILLNREYFISYFLTLVKNNVKLMLSICFWKIILISNCFYFKFRFTIMR